MAVTRKTSSRTILLQRANQRCHRRLPFRARCGRVGPAQISVRDMQFDDPASSRTGHDRFGEPLRAARCGRLTVNALRLVDYRRHRRGLLRRTRRQRELHRLFNEVDVQGRFGRSWFDYDAREGIVPHQDLLDTTGASVGYNLRNRTAYGAELRISATTLPCSTPSAISTAAESISRGSSHCDHASRVAMLVALTAGQSAAVTASATPAPPPSQVIRAMSSGPPMSSASRCSVRTR